MFDGNGARPRFAAPTLAMSRSPGTRVDFYPWWKGTADRIPADSRIPALLVRHVRLKTMKGWLALF